MKLKIHIFSFLVMFSTGASNSLESICGKSDSRQLSQLKPVARILKKLSNDGGCTGTLISPSCMISAGHCVPETKFVEFNVPISNVDGKTNHPSLVDQYEVENILGSTFTLGEKDWQVFRLKPNALTGKTAGEVQGYYSVRKTPTPFATDAMVRITGYGASKGILNYSQQTDIGKVAKLNKPDFKIHYVVDTTGGTSGSAVILESTEEVIGIHTMSGCGGISGSNFGMNISAIPELLQLINQCQAMDGIIY